MGAFHDYLTRLNRPTPAQQHEEDTDRDEGLAEALDSARELGRRMARSVRSGHRRKLELMDLQLRD